MTEKRAKYSAEQLRHMLSIGHAIANEHGEPSYPIGDAEDLHNAIHAIGRGGTSHEKIRRYIIKRAREMGMTDALPDDWTERAADKELAYRASLVGVRETRRMSEFELREKDAGTLHFEGYASVFDHPYEVNSALLGTFEESVAPRAFRRSLSEGADVSFLINHDDMALPLARTKSGTMRLGEDSRGLHPEADFDLRNPAVLSLRSAVERGDVDEMSFAFRVYEGGQEWSQDYSKRRLTSVNLHKGDVSLVNSGANPATAGSVSIRSAEDALRELRAGRALPLDAIELLDRALAARISEPPPLARGMSIYEAEVLLDS